MNTNKLFLWIAASLMSGAVCAASAMAEPAQPDAYRNLRAVELQPGQAPRLTSGFQELSFNERRFAEPLPMQLAGPIQKVKATKYKPHQRPKHKARKAKTSRS